MKRILLPNPVRLLPAAIMLLLTAALGSYARVPQQRTIQGRIVSAEDNQGFPGVNVVVKGTTNGTVTDVDGRYSVEIPSDDAILVFSSIGYATQELVAGKRSTIDLALEPDVKSLSEVVVIGYGTAKKSDITGSVASVGAEQIQAFPVQNVTQALQGRAAGVDVNIGNFRPGEAPTIRVRGNRSLKAGNDPLYVLDGIPLAQGSSITEINPQDIESMEILKDASATAIYGSRGANGVVLITSKKGKEGRARISYDASFGFEKPLRKMEMFNGAEFAELRRNAYRTTGNYSTAYPNPKDDFTLFGTDPFAWENIAAAYDWVDKPNRIAREVDGVPVYDPSKIPTTDWQDMVLRTALNQNHQVSVSGGTDKIHTLFSVGYLNQEGIQRTQDFERYTVRVNFDYKVNDILTIGASTNASFSVQNYGADMYAKAVGQVPFAVPFDPQGNYIRLPGGDDKIINPLRDDQLIFNERRSTRFLGSFFAELNLAKGLRYRMNFGPDYTYYRNGEFQASTSSERAGTSYGRYLENQRFSWVLENLLFYDRSFGDHSIGVTLLQSSSAQRQEGSDITAQNLPYDSQKWYALETTYNGKVDAFNTDYTRFQLMSWMGRVNYGYRDKYLLTLTGRYDGSSVLAPGNKWAFFPSAALAWKLQQEQFLSNATFINELKLRVGYGITGNAAVSPYTVNGTLTNTNYVFNETPAKGYAPSSIPTPALGWEKTAQINAGIDFGFFNDRITGTVDAYIANTNDLLMDRAIPTISGFSSVSANVGKTRNKGIEITISTVNINAPSGISWSTDLTFTKNKEEIIELYGAKNDDVGNRWFIGQPINTYYDYKFAGIWQSNETEAIQRYKENGTTIVPGTIKIVDKDNNYKLNAEDYMILGSNVPDWSGGITNRVGYKGFELSCFVFIRQGQGLYNRARVPTLAGRYPDRKINYWTPDNPSNEYPIANRAKEFPEYYTALYYKDASFVKIKNITLSYTFPTELISPAKVRSLNVYVTALNPFLFTNYDLLDPESLGDPRGSTSALNGLSTKSLVFGVRLGL